MKLWFSLLLWSLSALAAAAEFPADDPKPFAEARVILQLSDADERKQSIVLDVANNLIKHYGGPDMVDIEIIAFGPGIGLLYADNPRGERIDWVHSASRRVLSRKAAKKRSKGRAIHRELADKGILVKWTGRSTLAEEMPDAYKDIDAVIEVVDLDLNVDPLTADTVSILVSSSTETT